MKIKELLSITLKILGLVAFWKSILAFGAVISGIGIFFSFMNNDHMNASFMIGIGLAMILNFVLPLLVAFLFIFRTEKVLSIIKIKDHEKLDLELNKSAFYYVIIIVFGLFIIIDGAGNFLKYNYQTDTKTEYITNNVAAFNQIPNTSRQEKVSVTNSESKNVNYFAFIEIILGIILLAKASEIAMHVERKFDLQFGGLPEETNI